MFTSNVYFLNQSLVHSIDRTVAQVDLSIKNYVILQNEIADILRFLKIKFLAK